MKTFVINYWKTGVVLIPTILLGFVIFSYTWIEHRSNDHVYTRIENVKHHRVGLVLGTNKFVKSGRVNLYFQHRVNAAVTLFKAGIIEYILVSGDNGTRNYNEPLEFKKVLVKAGIPDDRIVLDYAGFRTLDSVVRAKKVFGQDDVLLISQAFHNKRALFLARSFGIKADAFNAAGVPRRYGIKTELREVLARCKAVIDVVLGVQPKFLGEKITI